MFPVKPKVYIDGKDGTTGLQIYERLGGRSDIELLLIDGAKRKDPAERKKLMDAADVDPMAEDAAQRYAEAAQRLVAAVPEFVPAGGTGSSGEHPRRAANPNDDTTSAFRRGMGR